MIKSIKSIKAGFIGTGNIAGAHFNFLKARDDVEITALCEIDEKMLENRRQKYGGRCYTDFRQMLDDEDLDAVWLCTPPQVRREPLLACTEREIPVFCEKPVERSLEKAEQIDEELTALKARIQIGYVFRSMPAVQKLREAISKDNIHAFQSIYICNLSLTRDLDSWLFDKERSGGALIDQATHNLDLLRYFFGEATDICGFASNPVREKNKGYTIDEVLSLNLIFENNLLGSHTHSWIGDGWRNEIIMSGEKSLYRINLCDACVTRETGADTYIFTQEKTSIYSFENSIFLDQVASGNWDNNPSDYSDGVKSLKLALDCDASLKKSPVNTI